MDHIEIITSGPQVSEPNLDSALNDLLVKSKGCPKPATEDKRDLTQFWTTKPLESPVKALGGVYWVSKAIVFDGRKLRPEWSAIEMQPATMPGQWASSIKAYYEHPSKPDVVGLPRFLGLSMFGQPKQDLRVLGMPLSSMPDLRSSLRPLQTKAVDQTVASLEAYGGASIIADCGFGKTRIAMALIAALGRKTLVLCNREVLMLQWADVVAELSPWTISWLQGSAGLDKKRIKVGPKYFAGPCEPSDVCIASIDTLIEGLVDRNLLATFGTVIVDEAHHLSAASLVHALPLVPARYVVGLSATPDRRDGLEHGLYWLAGPTSFVYKRLPSITGLKDTVLVQKLSARGLNEREKMYASGQLAFAEMLTLLSEDTRRNKMLLDAIVECLPERRKIIVVSALVAHCKMLYDAIAAVGHGPLALMAGPNIESLKAKDPSTRIVFATYSLLEEGYDDPVLDTLVLATPRSRIQQTIGRIERTLEGKLRPMVIDLVDHFSVYPNMWAKRHSFYKSRGFEIMSV